MGAIYQCHNWNSVLRERNVMGREILWILNLSVSSVNFGELFGGSSTKLCMINFLKKQEDNSLGGQRHLNILFRIA